MLAKITLKKIGIINQTTKMFSYPASDGVVYHTIKTLTNKKNEPLPSLRPGGISY